MYEQPAYGLQTTAGENIVLQSVNVEVAFSNLLCETSMTQVYQNQGKKPIEAVYTFPLASNAVLLDLKVTIGNRELQGKVVEKASAEEQYEDAITDGDSAIMLEQLHPCLYTMNVGNLMAETFADISKNDWGASYPLGNETNQEINETHG
ncbi:MAG: VIT domain-containing protein [Dissulfuribacterales bacterium]